MKNTTQITSTMASLISHPRLPLRRTAQVIFAAVVLATGGLILEIPAPALAHHRNVGDGECSWFLDRLLPTYDFHEACTNHDACGERAGSNQLAWDACDRQLKADAERWCVQHHSNWNPLRYSCLSYANTMYWGLRAFVNGTGIHRD